MRFLLLTFYFWSLWNSWFKNSLHSPFSYLTGLGSLEKKVWGGLGIKSGPMCWLLPVADHACMPGTKGPPRYYVFKGEPLFSIFPFLWSHPLGIFKKFFSLNSFYQVVLILQVIILFNPNYFLWTNIMIIPHLGHQVLLQSALLPLIQEDLYSLGWGWSWQREHGEYLLEV